MLSRQREEKGKQPNPEPDSQSANSCRSPNSGSSRGRRRVPGPPPLPLAPLGVQRGCGRQWGARPSSQNPPSVPAAAPAPLSFSCSGPSRQRRRDRGRGRARPARRLFAGSRKPRPRAAVHRWPSPRRLSAGSCSQTDWRCPAGRLKGGPTSRPPGPPRPARGRERPAPPARARALGGRGASGKEVAGGGRRQWGVTRASRTATRFPTLHPRPSRVFCSALASRQRLCKGLRLSQKFVPGHEPLVVLERGGRDQRPAAPRAPRGSSCPAVRAGRQCHPAWPAALQSRRAALAGGSGKGEPGDQRGCGGLRASTCRRRSEVAGRPGSRERRALAAIQPSPPASRDRRATLPGAPALAALLCLRLPGGPELASGRAAKAAVTLQEGFGRNL